MVFPPRDSLWSLLYRKPRAKNWLNGIRIFVSAQNWLTLTKYKGVDPEVSSKGSDVNAGIDHLTYPNSKTLSMGVSVKF